LEKHPGFSGLFLFLAAPVREGAAWVLHLVLRHLDRVKVNRAMFRQFATFESDLPARAPL